MNTEAGRGMDAQLQAWVKQTMDTAVQELTRSGLYQGSMVEARPAWVLPHTLLIGKIREQGEESSYDWFICGDCPTDRAPSTVAASPREAARHFALQWQLDAARSERGEATPPGRPVVEQAGDLVRRAESLYELTQKPGFWAS